jgi:hypothetical protein
METLSIIEVDEQVEGAEAAAGDGHGYNIEAVRELARKAFPDTIPELIVGETYEEVMTSVERARAAYARVFMEVEERQAVVKPPVVPAGGSSAVVVDVERLPAAEKLRRGVGAVRRREGGNRQEAVSAGTGPARRSAARQ